MPDNGHFIFIQLIKLFPIKTFNMRKIYLLILLTFAFYFNGISQNETNLIIVHPTEYNLKLFTFLIDNEIIQVENLKITGVYHKKETYDYAKSVNFLKDNSYPFIELKGISEPINQDKLYQKNSLSEIFDELFKNSDGIFFFGGPDLPAAIYGEQMSLLTRMTDPYRHYFEASFLFHLLGGTQNNDYKPLLENRSDFTVYAICLGMQTMNIATGGTMIQDIPSELYGFKSVEEVLSADNNIQHRNYNNNLVNDSTLFSGNFHEIEIINQLPLVGNYTENLQPLIYSNHHQAIEKLGKNLEVIATSIDGKIIEAIKHKKYHHVLGIQFHPEGSYLHNDEFKYRKVPTDKLKSGKEILIDNNSYQFHLEFWKTFSKKLTKYQ